MLPTENTWQFIELRILLIADDHKIVNKMLSYLLKIAIYILN